MPPVIKVGDQVKLVPCSAYPHAKFPFEFFNPIQSRVLDFYDQECNAVISASTAAGKTVVAEMFAAHHIRKNSGKFIYLAPMKALAKEKYDDWTDPNHHFSDLKVALCTGDYRLTPDRKKELEEANIVILTPETLNSRTRNVNSEQTDWLKNENILCVFDEFHLVTVPSRGDHAEVGVMKLSAINKNVRFILLSATMPNVSDIANWVSYTLTGKDTYLLESKYRPCPLTIEYESYSDYGMYDQQEQAKVDKAVEIIERFPNDKFLLFVHTKRTGDLLKKALQGYKVEFHSADLNKDQREKLEKNFKTGDLKYLIATSTLAWGCCAKGTIVSMYNGTVKKIEDIQVGDKVVSYTGTEFGEASVLKTGTKKVDGTFEIQLESGESCVVSEDHEFFSAIKRDKPTWNQTKQIQIGDYIATSPGLKLHWLIPGLKIRWSRVSNIVKTSDVSEFYDIEVEKHHNYLSNGMISHNCNTPARRVVILGIHRGLTEVATYDIFQEIGRSGRPGFDPEGNAYVLLPQSKRKKHEERLQTPELIESRLLENYGGHYKTLAFHLVSEIHHGGIKNNEDVHEWYKRTLAYSQSQGLTDEIVESTMKLLLECGAIKQDEDGTYRVSIIGLVSSMFYYSPFDIADLRRNFMSMFKSGNLDDLHVSMALGDTDSARVGIVSRVEREEMADYQLKVIREFGSSVFLDPAIKSGYAHYCAMNGINAGPMVAMVRTVQWDFPRVIQVLTALSNLGCKWDQDAFFKNLQSRVLYGVDDKLIDFVKLPGIGRQRAERLWQVGFRSLEQIVSNPAKLQSALNLNPTKINEIINAAKGVILTG